MSDFLTCLFLPRKIFQRKLFNSVDCGAFSTGQTELNRCIHFTLYFSYPILRFGLSSYLDLFIESMSDTQETYSLTTSAPGKISRLSVSLSFISKKKHFNNKNQTSLPIFTRLRQALSLPRHRINPRYSMRPDIDIADRKIEQ